MIPPSRENLLAIQADQNYQRQARNGFVPGDAGHTIDNADGFVRSGFRLRQLRCKQRPTSIGLAHSSLDKRFTGEDGARPMQKQNRAVATEPDRTISLLEIILIQWRCHNTCKTSIDVYETSRSRRNPGSGRNRSKRGRQHKRPAHRFSGIPLKLEMRQIGNIRSRRFPIIGMSEKVTIGICPADCHDEW